MNCPICGKKLTGLKCSCGFDLRKSPFCTFDAPSSRDIRELSEYIKETDRKEKEQKAREEEERLAGERARKAKEEAERLAAEKARKAKEEERIAAEKAQKARTEALRLAAEKAREQEQCRKAVADALETVSADIKEAAVSIESLYSQRKTVRKLTYDNPELDLSGYGADIDELCFDAEKQRDHLVSVSNALKKTGTIGTPGITEKNNALSYTAEANDCLSSIRENASQAGRIAMEAAAYVGQHKTKPVPASVPAGRPPAPPGGSGATKTVEGRWKGEIIYAPEEPRPAPSGPSSGSAARPSAGTGPASERKQTSVKPGPAGTRRKKWGGIALMLLVFIAAFLAGYYKTNRSLPFINARDSAAVAQGDVITLGRYEQDNVFDNGAEEIRWQVREVKDGKALLVSEKSLDVAAYNEGADEETAWSGSSLRAWLNEDFLDAAFSAEEQSLILETELETDVYVWGGSFLSDREKTSDRIFIEDLHRKNDSAEPSVYAAEVFAEDRRAAAINKEPFPGDWVRTPSRNDSDEERSLMVGHDSEKPVTLFAKPDKHAFVCPAFYLDLKAYKEYLKKDHTNAVSVTRGRIEAQREELSAGLKEGRYRQVLYENDRILCVNRDGSVTIISSRKNDAASNELSGWSGIVSLVPLYNGTAGLKEDGTVVSNGSMWQGTVDTSGWSGIVQLEASNSEVLLGLREDGTVICSPNLAITPIGSQTGDEFAETLEKLRGSVKLVSAQTKDIEILGLSAGGKPLYDKGVYTFERGGETSRKIEKWTGLKDIVCCSTGTDVIGLTNKGTLLYGGVFGYSGDDDMLDGALIESWTDISAIAAGSSHLAALRSDGTVCAAGQNRFGECDVDEWTGIVRIEASGYTTVGYKADGSVVMAGRDPLEERLKKPLVYSNR